MARIKAKKSKRGTTYYLVYSLREKAVDGSAKKKVKRIKVGSIRPEAESALREFNREHCLIKPNT